MKRFTLLSLALIFAVGCQLQLGNTPATNTTAENTTYWLNYFPTQCNEVPWGETLDDQAVIAYYENLGVNVIAVEVEPTPDDFFTCAACGCSTGETIGVQTDAVGRDILLDHGFTEEETAEDLPLDLNANVNDNSEGTVPANTNVDAGADEISAAELVDPATGEVIDVEAELSVADANLQTRAEQLQMELTSYYSNRGSYPDDIAALNTAIDLTGLTYTPIGVTPADYYDLSVDYSTGREVLNP